MDQSIKDYEMRSVTATEARVHFGQLLRRVVEERETVVVERAGRPEAVVLSLVDYEGLLAARGGGAGWRERVRVARELIQADIAGRSFPPPEEVLRELRDGRDEQLDGLR